MRYFIIHLIPSTALWTYIFHRETVCNTCSFLDFFFFNFNCSFSPCLWQSVYISLLSVNIRLITAVLADFIFFLIKYWVSYLFINLSFVVYWILWRKKNSDPFYLKVGQLFNLNWEHFTKIYTYSLNFWMFFIESTPKNCSIQDFCTSNTFNGQLVTLYFISGELFRNFFSSKSHWQKKCYLKLISVLLE